MLNRSSLRQLLVLFAGVSLLIAACGSASELESVFTQNSDNTCTIGSGESAITLFECEVGNLPEQPGTVRRALNGGGEPQCSDVTPNGCASGLSESGRWVAVEKVTSTTSSVVAQDKANRAEALYDAWCDGSVASYTCTDVQSAYCPTGTDSWKINCLALFNNIKPASCSCGA